MSKDLGNEVFLEGMYDFSFAYILSSGLKRLLLVNLMPCAAEVLDFQRQEEQGSCCHSSCVGRCPCSSPIARGAC